VKVKKNYSNATSIYILGNYILNTTYSTRQFDTLLGLGSLGQSNSIPCSSVLYADPQQCLYAIFALVLFAYCYKKKPYKKKFFSLYSPKFCDT